MIDRTLLRDKPDYVIATLAKKEPSFDVKKLVELDQSLRSLQVDVERLRSEKNELAQQGKKGVTPELREKSKEISQRLQYQEDELTVVKQQFDELYLTCPNLIFDEIPAGNKESNVVVKTWGKQPTFAFEPKHHVALNDQLNWFNFAVAAEMSASNFVFYNADGAKLIYALALYMLNNNMKHGFTPALPPYVVSEKSLEGAAQFPKFKNAVYSIPEDNLYLTPTSEVNLANLYRNNIFATVDLPVRMTSWTSCFRREAGTYGATERGLIRIHQFEKVELFAICTPEQANAEQERMLASAEEILQKLGLHYRVSLLAAQDCSFASAKTYDIEVWMPGQKEYKEVSSISNCTDFQSRRTGIRYRAHAQDKTQLVYTLNGSSLALPRLIVALMETYQQADGTIKLPDVLKSVTWSC